MIFTNNKKTKKRKRRGARANTRAACGGNPPIPIVPNRIAPIILQLKLVTNHDPEKILHFIQLKEFMNYHCSNYWYEEHEFKNWDTDETDDTDETINNTYITTLRKTLEMYPDHSIAHFILVTHATATSLLTGKNESLHISSNAFNDFMELLRRKLMKGAGILLSSCLTGQIYGKISNALRKVYGEKSILYNEFFDKYIHDLKTNTKKPFELIEIRNWCYPNVANTLSKRLLNHPIYCTLHKQYANELAIPTFKNMKETCASNQSLQIVFVSSRQLMYRYINTVDNCKEMSTPTTIDVFQFDCKQCINTADPVTFESFSEDIDDGLVIIYFTR